MNKSQEKLFHWTKVGKKFLIASILDQEMPDNIRDSRLPYKLVPCTAASTPTEFTEFLDELVEVTSDCGFPRGGWDAREDEDIVSADEDDIHWFYWTLHWTAGRSDGGDCCWLVVVNKLRQVLGYIDVAGDFVTSEQNINKLQCRQLQVKILT